MSGFQSCLPCFPSPLFLPIVHGPGPQLARTPSWWAGGYRSGWCPPCARLRLLRLKRVDGDRAGTGQDGWALWCPHGLADPREPRPPAPSAGMGRTPTS